MIIGTSSFGLATVAGWQSHQGYWHSTTSRVQTTNFNLLAHMLPTKLSSVLIQGDLGELQRTLDSNQGLFGLVVTDCSVATRDCPGQRIRYVTNSTQAWRKDLKVERLLNQPYDLLRDPPPLLTEGGFDSARDLDRTVTGQTNPGRIIGRVYYIRGVPPLFRDTYPTWLQSWPRSLLSDQGADRFYTLTFALFAFAGLTVWGWVEHILHRQREQKRLAQQTQAQLVTEAQNLQAQLQTQLKQQNTLLTELEQYRQQQGQLIQDSNQAIAQYESQLALKEIERQTNTTTIAEQQQLLLEQVQGQAQIEQRSQAIAQLQNQIEALQAENQRVDETRKQLQADLQLSQQQAHAAQTRIQELDTLIAALMTERDLAQEKIRELEQQIEDFEIYVLDEHERLRHQNQALIQEQSQVVEQLDTLQAQIWELEEQLEWYQNQWRAAFSPTVLPQPTSTAEPGTVPLSELSLALVGGHASVRRGVLKILCEDYGLQLDKSVEVPPTSEQTTNRSLLKEKVGHRDLVVVITPYIGHDLTDMISALKSAGSLSGEVLLVNQKGQTGIVRAILAHVQKAD